MVKISNLPAAIVPLVGTEELALVQGGETRKVNAEDLGLGGGTGEGGINYIENSQFEENADDWVVTGPNMGFTRTTVVGSVLRGVASGQFVGTGGLDAENTYVAYPFTIDKADVLKVLRISFDYRQTHQLPTYAVQVVADPGGTPVVVYDSSGLTPADTGRFADYFSATQATDYELRLVRISNTTQSRAIQIDNVIVGPQELAIGPNVGDWVDTGPVVIQADTTNPTKGTIDVDRLSYRRVGDSAEIKVEFRQTTSGTAGSGEYRFPLPAGLAIDLAKFISGGWDSSGVVGTFLQGTAATASNRQGFVFIEQGVSSYVRFRGRRSGNADRDLETIGSADGSLGSAISYSAIFTVPIQGWAANAPVSPMNQPYMWAERFAATATQVTDPPARLGEYRSRQGTTDTAPSPAPTAANGVVITADTPAGGEVNYYDIYIGKNVAVSVRAWSGVGRTIGASLDRWDNAGVPIGTYWTVSDDNGILTIACAGSAGSQAGSRYFAGTAATGTPNLYRQVYFDLLITPKTNPLALTQESVVGLFAYQDNGFSIPNNTLTVMPYVATQDTHGAWDGTTFTVPRAGWYQIAGRVGYSGNSSGSRDIFIYVDGSPVAMNRDIPNSSSAFIFEAGSALYLAAGALVTIRTQQSSGGSRATLTDEWNNTLSIVEIR